MMSASNPHAARSVRIADDTAEYGRGSNEPGGTAKHRPVVELQSHFGNVVFASNGLQRPSTIFTTGLQLPFTSKQTADSADADTQNVSEPVAQHRKGLSRPDDRIGEHRCLLVHHSTLTSKSWTTPAASSGSITCRLAAATSPTASAVSRSQTLPNKVSLLSVATSLALS